MIMENQAIVTILTPTYNRVDKLIDLYQTLCMQKDKRFVWCVVDDGSTDSTENAIKEVVNNSPFSLIYIKKENGGKHTALNEGIKLAATPLVFIVDSDDTLMPDAVETIAIYFEKYKEDEEICGFSFLRAFSDGKINGSLFAKDEWIASYIDARVNSNDMASDKAEVYKTKCLREFPFPVYENEKFLGEDIVWTRMARKYKTVHINKAIYVGEYQSDGLTRNRRLHNLNSPNGCVTRAKEYLENDICLKMRIKSYPQYLIYGMVAKHKFKSLLKDAPNKFLCLLLFFPALFIMINWTRQYKNKKSRD